MPAPVDGAVIIAGAHPEEGHRGTLDVARWDRVDATMWDTLTVLQRARQSAKRIVLVTPTIGLAGAGELVAYTTAVEGIRAMAKSAARQWRSEGIVVNMVAASDPECENVCSRFRI